MLAVALYLNAGLARTCAIYIGALNVVVSAKNFIMYPELQKDSLMNGCFMVLFCIVCVIVVKTMAKHAEEDTDAIKDQMDSAAKVASEIIEMSEKLADKFDGAREKAEILTESMTTSNNSVKEIASSVKLTAEAMNSRHYRQMIFKLIWRTQSVRRRRFRRHRMYHRLQLKKVQH